MVLFQSMFSAFLFLEQRYDDDFADRLSYFYTSVILLMMAVLVSFKQFGGRPLECWVPAQFKESWEAYAEMYCWAQNTYWVPFSEQIPVGEGRSSRQISYYQWVPFFLLLQAFMFYFPCLLWRLLNGLSGIRLHDLISVFREKENIDPEIRARTTAAVARHLEYALRFQHTLRSGGSLAMHRVLKCLNLRYYEAYVTWLYLLIKCFYLVNVFVNLFLMNRFLQTDDYSLYGFGVIVDLLKGSSWSESGYFPRVTLCDFRIRILGQVQQHTVQCVLVINIFIEKIFIFLWIWFSILSAVTLIDLLYWCGVSLKQQDRLHFMLRNLHLSAASGGTMHPDEDQVHEFVSDYIKVDGILVLRMVSLHVGSMCCTELAKALWHRFLLSKGEAVICSGSEDDLSPVPPPETADTDSSSESSSEDDKPPKRRYIPSAKNPNFVASSAESGSLHDEPQEQPAPQHRPAPRPPPETHDANSRRGPTPPKSGMAVTSLTTLRQPQPPPQPPLVLQRASPPVPQRSPSPMTRGSSPGLPPRRSSPSMIPPSMRSGSVSVSNDLLPRRFSASIRSRKSVPSVNVNRLTSIPGTSTAGASGSSPSAMEGGTAANPDDSLQCSSSNPLFTGGTFGPNKPPKREEARHDRFPHYFQPFFS